MNHKKTEILLVGFRNLSVLKSEFEQAFSGRRVICAKSVAEGMAKAESDNVLIQPVYLLPGFEYEKLCSDAAVYGGRVTVGKPILSLEENIAALAGLLFREYGSKQTLLVGHGTEHSVLILFWRSFVAAAFQKARSHRLPWSPASTCAKTSSGRVRPAGKAAFRPAAFG